MKSTISIIIPCFNSEHTIETVVSDIKNVMAIQDYAYQIILVNDCSQDAVWRVIVRLCEDDHNIIGLSLSRNFGQQSARMAALEYVTGDYIVFMDDDGQHKANDAIRMVEKLKEGYDIVYAYFRRKKKSIFRVWGSVINRKMTDWVMKTPKDVHTSSFFVTRRYVIEQLKNYKNPTPYTFGYFLQITRNVTDIEVEHHDRLSGHSGYSLKKLLRLWMDGFTGFSIIPLRISSVVGMIMAGIGFIGGIMIVVHKLLNPSVAAGYTSTISVILFCSGMILLMLGMLGEYIGRIFMILNNLPQFVIRDYINIKGIQYKLSGDKEYKEKKDV